MIELTELEIKWKRKWTLAWRWSLFGAIIIELFWLVLCNFRPDMKTVTGVWFYGVAIMANNSVPRFLDGMIAPFWSYMFFAFVWDLLDKKTLNLLESTILFLWTGSLFISFVEGIGSGLIMLLFAIVVVCSVCVFYHIIFKLIPSFIRWLIVWLQAK